jgi:hypothetical protein
VAVPGRTLLLAMAWALGAVHVEDEAARRLAVMDAVDPGARQIGEASRLASLADPLGLEATHLAAQACLGGDVLVE